MKYTALLLCSISLLSQSAIGMQKKILGRLNVPTNSEEMSQGFQEKEGCCDLCLKVAVNALCCSVMSPVLLIDSLLTSLDKESKQR